MNLKQADIETYTSLCALRVALQTGDPKAAREAFAEICAGENVIFERIREQVGIPVAEAVRRGRFKQIRKQISKVAALNLKDSIETQDEMKVDAFFQKIGK